MPRTLINVGLLDEHDHGDVGKHSHPCPLPSYHILSDPYVVINIVGLGYITLTNQIYTLH